jgi:hypothetical protein
MGSLSRIAGRQPEAERPKDMKAYRDWLRREHKVDVTGRLETRYEAVVSRLRDEFRQCAYWQEVLSVLRDFDADYRLSADGYPLFTPKQKYQRW